MKKTTKLLMAVCIAVFIVSCGTTTKQTNVATSTENATSSGASMGSGLLNAVMGNLINKVTTFKTEHLLGTWTFAGSDCKFETENFLKQAGGEMAATTVEQKLDEVFAKVGLKAGAMTITFNENGTYITNIGGYNLNGTYTYDTKTSILTMNGMFGMTKMTTTLSYTTFNNISLLFDADKLIGLFTEISNRTNNTTIQTVATLLGSYDGVKVGAEFNKN